MTLPDYQLTKSKTTKFAAGIIGLCALGCAAAPIIAGVGLIGVGVGAYLGWAAAAGVVVVAALVIRAKTKR